MLGRATTITLSCIGGLFNVALRENTDHADAWGAPEGAYLVVPLGLPAQKDDEAMTSEDRKHRSHLPIPTPERTGLITYDAKDPDTKFPPIEQLRPPKGAPNVLIILLDDAGFGSSSAFGGPCQTPNAEKLAAGGLK